MSVDDGSPIEGKLAGIAGIRLSLISITTTRTLGGEGGGCPPLFGAYYCFPRKSSRTTLFTSEVDSSFESADCWFALSSVGEPDQFSHLPIFHIDSLYFEFRADCSAVAVDLITFSSAFKKEPLPTRFRYRFCCLSMADEPAVPVSRVSDAHDAMEGQLSPPCKHLSESGVSIRDGTWNGHGTTENKSENNHSF